MFNPDEFLHVQIDQANDTKRTPVPVGEYTAVVDDVKLRPWQSKDGSQSGLALDVVWAIDDANVKALLGREKVTSRQGIMLDLLESGKGLDMGKGKNTSLGRLREATGLNVPGQPFSFPMLVGRVAKVRVSHRVDGEDIYDEIKAVAKLG